MIRKEHGHDLGICDRAKFSMSTLGLMYIHK